MTRREAEKKAAELARILTGYQRAYYVDAKPLVSDREYDGLFDELSRSSGSSPIWRATTRRPAGWAPT